MPTTTVVVIGAGHCGLAMSSRLTALSIDHVVLDRGEAGNSWRTQRWDSLRLLTPNWMTRLPGYAYSGDDPDGYQSAGEVVEVLAAYSKHIDVPLLANTEVTAVRKTDGGYVVETDQGVWHARAVVVATGATAVPSVPAVADDLPGDIVSVTTSQYRRPDSLPDGGVLVVGASSSGIQIAEELQLSGRQVTLAVGEHVRLPRVHRGRDILWWMEKSGILDERYDQIPDLLRARSLPSMQLVGSPQRRTLDLNSLQDNGVQLVGRLAGVRDGNALFSGSLPNVVALADLKLQRLLDSIDTWDGFTGQRAEVEPTRIPAVPRLELNLRSAGVRSVLWATGYRPDHSWLHAGTFDRRRRIRHDGGVAGDGLFFVGLPFQRRRKSTLIDGAVADSADIAAHVEAYLAS